VETRSCPAIGNDDGRIELETVQNALKNSQEYTAADHETFSGFE
jgi:hypothetical protein